MRRKVIAGNWKMNMTPSQAKALIEETKPLVAGKDNCDVIFCVPYVDIFAAQEAAKGSNIKIGAENEFEELSNSSMITVNYSMNDKSIGRIGVIGPKRMNYAKVIASLDCISNHVDKILYELYNKEGDV